MTARPEMWVDPSPGPGAGHLARTLALVQAWTDLRGDVVAVDRGMPSSWRDQFALEGPVAADPPGADCDVIVVDGYDAAPRALTLKRQCPDALLVAIDDHSLASIQDPDVVIDQNLGARADRYRSEVVLVGPDYALLRREFRTTPRPSVRKPPTFPRLLLAAGGSPPPAVSEWLDEIGVLLSHRVEPVALRGITDVPELLTSIDFAVSAAGSTMLELCWAGVPAAVFSWADNQRPVAEAVQSAAIGLDLGDWSKCSAKAAANRIEQLLDRPERVGAAATRARGIVDGRGAERVAVRLRSELLDVREATGEDVDNYFEWANDPVVRAASFHPETIRRVDHDVWFEDRLADPDVWLYVVERRGEPVAQVRIETEGGPVGMVDVSVSERGSGWGAPAISRALRHLAAHAPVERVVAEIRLENRASASAFERAGFAPTISGRSDALRYDFVLHA